MWVSSRVLKVTAVSVEAQGVAHWMASWRADWFSGFSKSSKTEKNSGKWKVVCRATILVLTERQQRPTRPPTPVLFQQVALAQPLEQLALHVPSLELVIGGFQTNHGPLPSPHKEVGFLVY